MARRTDEEQRRTDAVRRALDAVPVSRREIARRAGLSHTTLNRIAGGERTASPSNERAVYDAIKQVRETCNVAMDLLLRGPSPATRGAAGGAGRAS
jgi:transcriptional regulator with XRE-family HTH domain